MSNKYLVLETPRSYKIVAQPKLTTIAYPPTHYTKNEARQVCEAITNALNATNAHVYVRENARRRIVEEEE